MTDTTKQPIEASADGKRNAFSHACAAVQHTKSYAVCLHLIDKVKTKGSLPLTYSDCEKAIEGTGCPARKMRAQEIEKGHAIYFVERIKGEHTIMEPGSYVGHKVSNFKKSKAATSSKVEAQSAQPQSAEDLFLNGAAGYDTAINTALSVQTKTESPQPAVDHIPGESLLEMARRLMNQNATKEATV